MGNGYSRRKKEEGRRKKEEGRAPIKSRVCAIGKVNGMSPVALSCSTIMGNW
jgi:hypothetical protein